jgi:hypothetical protein
MMVADPAVNEITIVLATLSVPKSHGGDAQADEMLVALV